MRVSTSFSFMECKIGSHYFPLKNTYPGKFGCCQETRTKNVKIILNQIKCRKILESWANPRKGLPLNLSGIEIFFLIFFWGRLHFFFILLRSSFFLLFLLRSSSFFLFFWGSLPLFKFSFWGCLHSFFEVVIIFFIFF